MTTKKFTQISVAAGAMLLLSTGIAAACHPKGVIQKDVQNITTHSALSKADTAASAVVAHPGDTLVYHITVSNVAVGKGNEMIKTMITDQLPAGLQLVSQDSFNVGTLSMKQSAERTITVKVTATSNTSIKNQACFTGDSTDHKQPQKGCDLAYVKVEVPTPTPTPTPIPSPTPTPPATPTPTPTPEVLGASTEQPVLPQTGAPVAASAVGLSAMIGSGVAYIKSRKRK